MTLQLKEVYDYVQKNFPGNLSCGWQTAGIDEETFFVKGYHNENYHLDFIPGNRTFPILDALRFHKGGIPDTGLEIEVVNFSKQVTESCADVDRKILEIIAGNYLIDTNHGRVCMDVGNAERLDTAKEILDNADVAYHNALENLARIAVNVKVME